MSWSGHVGAPLAKDGVRASRFDDVPELDDFFEAWCAEEATYLEELTRWIGRIVVFHNVFPAIAGKRNDRLVAAGGRFRHRLVVHQRLTHDLFTLVPHDVPDVDAALLRAV